MKCLSLWQPWAILYVLGEKEFETRHWTTGYRGPLLIHAAKKWTMELVCMCHKEPFASTLAKHHIVVPRPKLADHRSTMPFGCIIGAVDLVECYEIQDNNMYSGRLPLKPGELRGCRDLPSDREQQFGNYAPGRYAWQAVNPRRFETPIPYAGFQQLFNVPDELVAEQLQKIDPMKGTDA